MMWSGEHNHTMLDWMDTFTNGRFHDSSSFFLFLCILLYWTVTSGTPNWKVTLHATSPNKKTIPFMATAENAQLQEKSREGFICKLASKSMIR